MDRTIFIAVGINSKLVLLKRSLDQAIAPGILLTPRFSTSLFATQYTDLAPGMTMGTAKTTLSMCRAAKKTRQIA